ncbi:MAG: sigma-54-dependent Fis family transcriptional regulator, partial [Nitrospirae bacterium]|nr:sigma-54-dependent Fis family transcriptional regulator [Nitrospirota bacterium]
DGASGLEFLRARVVDLVLCDLRIPGISGIDLVRQMKEERPNLPIIIMTAYGTVESAVDLLKLGVYDYLAKPLNYEKLSFLIAKALEQSRLLSEVESLRSQVQTRYHFQNLVGKSRKMQEVYDLVARVAATDSTVLLEGETGTGKELAARAIHHSGPRRKGPFIAVNCAVFPETLLEAELFGHEKGAFTGAISEKKGDFELADGGTLFLDEIGSASPAAQAELLRVLQDREFRRVGGTKTIRVDVRVIAATNQDLRQRVSAGQFRQDLFYRLHVIPMTLPPLRERHEDIPSLVDHFLRKIVPGAQRKILAPETLQVLYRHHWPGNVRELENLVERLVVTCDREVIPPEALPPEILWQGSGGSEGLGPMGRMPEVSPVGMTLEEHERELIRTTLERTGGSRKQTAEILGISRKILWRKMRRYGMG